MPRVKIPSCKTSCNETQIMPLMKFYVEDHGLSVREASRQVEADFFKKYKKYSDVTASRARDVWRSRKVRNTNASKGAYAPPKSSTDAGLQSKKGIKKPEPTLNVFSAWEPYLDCYGNITTLGLTILYNGILKHCELNGDANRNKRIEDTYRAMKQELFNE